MSIQCDTDRSFAVGISKANNLWSSFDIFETYCLEISSPSKVEGLDVLYSVSESSLHRLFSRVIEDREVIVGLVGFDLFRSAILEINSQIGSELNEVLSMRAPS